MKRIVALLVSPVRGRLSRVCRVCNFAVITMILFLVSAGTASAHITSLVPSSTVAGGPDFALRILGFDFDASDTGRVLFDGTRVAATLISSEELRATIPASLIAHPRTVTVALEGFNSVQFTINPPGDCQYSSITISGGDLIGQIFPSDGGSGTINITAASNCQWGVLMVQGAPGAPFVSLTSAASESGSGLQSPGTATGTGYGTLIYSVMPNPLPARRSAVIRLYRRDFSDRLNVEPFTVTQEGSQCPSTAYSISPLNAVRDTNEGTGSFQITAPHDCQWTAVRDRSWIRVTPIVGAGNATLTYTVQRNEGPPRSAVIAVPGKEFFVFQTPSDCFIRTMCAFYPSACQEVGGGALTTSQRFRDEVLARTPRGQRYTNVYYKFSTEAVGILMLNPVLVLRSREMFERYKPVLDSMTRGEQVMITRSDLDDIESFLTGLAQKGSPALRESIEGLCDDLRDPQVHSEFNITVTDGPARELPGSGFIWKHASGATLFFALGLGAVFLARLGRSASGRRRKIGGVLLWLALASIVALSERSAMAGPAGERPGKATPATAPATFSAMTSGGGRPQIAADQVQPAADARLAFSTYFGGARTEEGNSIAVDSAGNLYVAGFTDSANFPLVNASQPNFGGGQQDAFVVKLDPSGTRVIYSTYIGGNGQDNATAIAVDPAGNAYITGFTASTNFPVRNALQPTKAGDFNAFVVKLDPSGSLLSSTMLGGSTSDYGSSIAVDAAANIYVAGIATSRDFPIANAIQGEPGGLVDVFVSKIDPSGSRLIYSTYLGGVGIDGASSIAVDSAGSVFLTGLTSSPNFRTVNALQPAHGGGLFDAFVVKLNPSGTQIIYSTFLGGSGEDRAFRIVVDSAGSAYVTGDTDSANFPMSNAAQPSKGGSADAFVAKLSPSGNQLVYSTYLGGSGIDGGTALAVDSTRSAYVTGFTASTDFPTARPLQQVFGGGYDGFIAKLTPAGSALEYSTYLGGSGIDSAFGVAADSTGASMMGVTDSTNFQTVNPLQPVNAGGTADIFIARLKAGPRIDAATVEGKKLFVNGSGFDNGAKILIDGQEQKTANDNQSPASLLIGKKSGKKVKRGQTATLQVRNSDGGLSNEFRFTRP